VTEIKSLRRSELSNILSKLEGFTDPDPYLEQVITPPESASGLLWEAMMRGDISGKAVVDLGCGTGRLAIGALLLGAASVTGVDSDPAALSAARRNWASLKGRLSHGAKVRWVKGNVERLPALEAETVLMNPPFGVQRKGAERPFLDAAISILLPGGAIYFFAAPGSQTFIETCALAQTIQVEDRSRSVWPFPHTFTHHTQRMGKVTVDRWILRRERS
jgi:putative methylase